MSVKKKTVSSIEHKTYFMKDLKFPLKFQFKISTFSNDFTATDASGATVAYVKQKMFKFKEDISIFNDESKSKVLYKIKADRWLDFSAAYGFVDAEGTALGKVARKGWRSIWKAEYSIIDQNEKLQYSIQEENPWVKVIDGLIGEVPILGMFTGYLFNPSYMVKDTQGKEIIRLKKSPSFFGRNFELIKLGQTDQDDNERLMLGLMMMILLERRRG